MKKILALVLAAIMLLGLVATAVSAEEAAAPAFKDVKVVLTDGIALRFTFKGLTAGEEYTINLKSEVYEEDVVVTADDNGEASATYDALTPDMFEMAVTATLKDTEITRTATVLEYCNWALNNENLKDQVHAIIVDLLNYAYAAELYKDDEAAAPTNSYWGRELTAAEEAAFAAYTAGSYYNAANFTAVNTIYSKIGLNITTNISSTNNIFSSLFVNNASGELTKDFIKSVGLPLDRASIDPANLTLYDMIVPNSWGGTWFYNPYRNTLTADSFEIGDMVVIRTASGSNWLALYTGNEKFFILNGTSKWNTGVTTMDNLVALLGGSKKIVYDSAVSENFSKPKSATWDADTLTLTVGAVYHYCILRPTHVLPNLDPVDSPAVGDNAVLGTTYQPAMLNQLAATDDQSAYAIRFGSAMPILWDSIGYRFYIASEIPEDTKFFGQLAGADAVELEVKENDKGKYVDFTALTPADLRKVVTVIAKDAEGNVISIGKQFSCESYAAWALNNGNAKLQNLVSAMMTYARGAENFVQYCSSNMDISVKLSECTNYEKVQKSLAQWTYETDDFDGKTTAAFVAMAFDYAGVDVSEYFTMTVSDTFWYWVSKKKPNPEKEGQPLYEMLVKDLYGGTYFTSTNDTSYPLSLDALQVGDIVMARYPDDQTSQNHCTMIYLGEGKFLYNKEKTSVVSIITLADVDDPATEDVNENINEYLDWTFYFVLRPSAIIN